MTHLPMDPWCSRPMPLHTSEYKFKASLSDSKLKDHGSLVKERFFLQKKFGCRGNSEVVC